MLKNAVFCRFLTANLRRNMATFRWRGKRVQVEICCHGIRKAKTFESKSAAQVWAAEQELNIRRGDRGEIPDKLFSDLLDRYVREVSPHKKGERWESIRIEAIKRDKIAQVRLKDLGSHHVSDWRDRRVTNVSGASVLREKTLLRHACQIAIDEWKWLKVNPFHKVRMPKGNRPRSRLMTDDERSRLIKLATTPVQKEVVRIMEFALETGMRASEICGLEKVLGNVAILEDTKNGESRRVPLPARLAQPRCLSLSAAAHRDRSHPDDTSRIPIVAMTAYPENYQRAELLAAGCEAFIVKPIDTRGMPKALEQFSLKSPR